MNALRHFAPELLITLAVALVAFGMWIGQASARKPAVNDCPCRYGPCECDEGSACQCVETKR